MPAVQVVSRKCVHNDLFIKLCLFCRVLLVCRRQHSKQDVSRRHQANRPEQEVSRGKMAGARFVFIVTLCVHVVTF